MKIIATTLFSILISGSCFAAERADIVWSGKYESNLMKAGLPISGGIAWATYPSK